MKILIFNGSMEPHEGSTARKISQYFADYLQGAGVEVIKYNIAAAQIPLLDLRSKTVPAAVKDMAEKFREADAHFWLSPLYHGSIPGGMKNCLDWLEITSRWTSPYLTGKVIGFVCWGEGTQAMQGINTMDAVAKALRAWTLPYSVPIYKKHLLDSQQQIGEEYKHKFDHMLHMLLNCFQLKQ